MVAKNYRRNDYRAIFYLWWCLLYRNNFLIVALAIAIPLGVYILLATQNLITDNISLQWNIFFNRNTLVSMFLFVQIFASLSICATCIGHFKEMHIADQIIVNYRKNKFIGTTFIYFFMVNVVCTIWAFAWYCVFNYSHLQDILQSYSSDGGNINIDVIGIILTNIINIIVVVNKRYKTSW